MLQGGVRSAVVVSLKGSRVPSLICHVLFGTDERKYVYIVTDIRSRISFHLSWGAFLSCLGEH